MKSVIFLVVILSLTFADQTGPTLQKVREGVAAGKEILDLIQAKSDSNSFHKISQIARKISPFLGAIGPIFSLVSMFYPSSEINYLKSEFRQINSKIDHVFYQLGEVRNLIEESSLKDQYASHEQTILSLSSKLEEYLRASASSASIFKRIFVQEYKSSFNGAAQKIYNGMMENGKVFSHDIPYTAMRFTEYHRRRTQNIMKGSLNLIIQGVKVTLAYHKAENISDHHYNAISGSWERKISSLIRQMTRKDNEVKNRWENQLSSDIDSKLSQYSGYSNTFFSDKLWDYLTEKYDWRDWFVVAYDPVRGGDKHWVKWCGGYKRFRQNGRNLVVASVDESMSPENAYSTKSMLQSTSTQEYRRGWWMNLGHTKYYGAEHIFDHELDWRFTSGCTYASVGVIKRGNDHAAVGGKGRVVYVTKEKVFLFAFS